MEGFIFFIIWVLSGWGVWWHYRRAYSPGGLWEGRRPNPTDFLDIFVPLWNTASFFIAWIIVGVPIKGRTRKKCKRFNFYQWFYQLKNKEEQDGNA